jgi:hypothetical protein
LAYASAVLGQEGGGESVLSPLVDVVLVLVGLFLYFLPSLLAARRQVPNAGSVFVLNLFLGWSLIGWVIALAMAFRDAPGPLSSGPAPRMRGAFQVTFTHSGSRYLFGTSFDPAGYAIWDRQRPGEPIERFPYSEHGKSEGFARYEAMEPDFEEVPPGGQPPA